MTFRCPSKCVKVKISKEQGNDDEDDEISIKNQQNNDNRWERHNKNCIETIEFLSFLFVHVVIGIIKSCCS